MQRFIKQRSYSFNINQSFSLTKERWSIFWLRNKLLLFLCYLFMELHRVSFYFFLLFSLTEERWSIFWLRRIREIVLESSNIIYFSFLHTEIRRSTGVADPGPIFKNYFLCLLSRINIVSVHPPFSPFLFLYNLGGGIGHANQNSVKVHVFAP